MCEEDIGVTVEVVRLAHRKNRKVVSTITKRTPMRKREKTKHKNPVRNNSPTCSPSHNTEEKKSMEKEFVTLSVRLQRARAWNGFHESEMSEEEVSTRTIEVIRKWPEDRRRSELTVLRDKVEKAELVRGYKDELYELMITCDNVSTEDYDSYMLKAQVNKTVEKEKNSSRFAEKMEEAKAVIKRDTKRYLNRSLFMRRLQTVKEQRENILHLALADREFHQRYAEIRKAIKENKMNMQLFERFEKDALRISQANLSRFQLNSIQDYGPMLEVPFKALVRDQAPSTRENCKKFKQLLDDDEYLRRFG